MSRNTLQDRLAMPAERRAEGGVVALAHVLGRAAAARHLDLGGDEAAADLVAAAAQALAIADAKGHSCLPIHELPAHALDTQAFETGDASAWQRRIASSPLGIQGARDCVFVVDGDARCYLNRHWKAERALAQAWARLDRPAPLVDDTARLRAALDRWFKPAPSPDWQRAAAATVLLRGACVISGGPGTGKTTTVVLALLALLELAPGLRCMLTAPTGKAAARLQESLQQQCDRLEVPAALRERLPREAVTVNRALGLRPDGTRRDDGPVQADVVVVDEASMLSLSLASQLVAALRPGTRLILLGDKDQLVSVETGLVLAQLSRERGWSAGAAQALKAVGVELPADLVGRTPAQDAVVWLTHSHRFGGAIAALASAVNDGDADAARAVLQASGGALEWLRDSRATDIVGGAIERYAPYFAALHAGAAPDTLLAEFARHRVLCALQGRAGAASGRSVVALNLLLEREAALRLSQPLPPPGGWFHGRPVMVTRNDAALGLVNGDIGVALRDAQGRLAVHFPAAHGLRAVPPGRLASCQTAFAMTVHKSQGSEFASVDVVLPEAGSRIASRELLYTAVTRARESVRLHAGAQALDEAIGRRTERWSGLAARIADARADPV